MLRYLLLVMTFSFFSFGNIPPNTYTYDTLNRLTNITHQNTQGTTLASFTYTLSPTGERTQIIELDKTTNYTYDDLGRLTDESTIDSTNGNYIASYTYDAVSNRIQSIIDGVTTQYTYDDNDRLTQQGGTTYTYDATGKQTQITDYANKTQKFIYDAYDKLVRIEYVDGSTVTYAYTPSGRVQSITDSQGTIANTYDTMGRLKTQTTSTSSVTATISYSYDSIGNITEIATPTQTITKTYDALNRLSTVTDAQGTVSYSYDELGRQTSIDYSNGMQTTYGYDVRNRIVNIVHKKSDGTVVQSFAYTLNEKGFRTKIVEHTGREVAYTYNAVDQLTSETITNDPSGSNTVTTFTYDDVDNLLTKSIDGLETNYSYNSNDQLITQNAITLTYDANGNLVSDGNNTYTYDDKNRLINITTPTDSIDYSYDANDNRVAKTTSNGTTTYLVDANTPYAQVITESKANGTTVEYTYGNDLLSDGSNNFLTDALGSTRGLVDSTESLTDSYNYTPYGKLTSHDGNATNSFLFTGEQFDSETEDYYLRARYYSPITALTKHPNQEAAA